jgi:hypothetical protein
MITVLLDINLRELCFDLSGFLVQQLNHPYHFVVEAILVVFIIYLLFQTSYKFKPKAKETLTEAVSNCICLLILFTPCHVFPSSEKVFLMI